MSRFKFFTRNQDSGEPIDDYVTALKLLTQYCEFEHLEEGLVRDRIVCGVRDAKLRDRLLRADELTLAGAVKICQANEMSTEEQREIEGTKTGKERGEGTSAMSIDAVTSRGGWRAGSRGGGGAGRARGAGRAQLPWRGGGGPAQRADNTTRKPCPTCANYRCDGIKCPAKNAMCFWCSERGHFKNTCPKLRRRVFQIDADVAGTDDDGEDLYYISTISQECDSKDSKWYETLILSNNGKLEHFKLDSGSDLNVMSLKTYSRLGLSVDSLHTDATTALSFCGNYIPIVGSTIIEWIYKNVSYKLHFVIADFECQSVLGKYACENMKMIQRIFSLSMDMYTDLFQGLGKLPGKYSIVVEKNVQPSICPVRKIPIGVRDKLMHELSRMEEMGVIRKVTHPTPWVNAIVVAPKKDGSIRVCLDPRPLNRAVRRAHYPLPTLTDIATKLEGAQVFSKLDARSGFWMIELDDASADLCTFGTPFGRYQFLRLPYGINCASEVFHSKVRQMLENLEGVDSFIDDVIVWGSSKTQHDERLKKLLDRAQKVGSDIFQYAGKYFLILVDYFSNFIEVSPLTNIGTKAVVAAMRDQFARHGIPSELISDNGPAYMSKEFAEFGKKWGFQHITTSPNYPQSNGLSERSVQIVKNILVKSIASGSDFYLGLLNYRATPRDCVSSPAELLMGRRLSTRLPTHLDKLKPERNNEGDYNNILKKQLGNKEYYDRKSKALLALQPGQPVLMADQGGRKYARVLGRAPQPRSYFVSDSSGRRYRRNRRHLLKLESAGTNDWVGTSREPISEDEQWLSPINEDFVAPSDVTPERAYLKAPALDKPRLARPAAIEARRKLNLLKE